MADIEVDEQRLTPEQRDYLIRWIAENGNRGTVDDPYTEDEQCDDGLNVWRGMAWALPVGLCFWGLVAWLW